MLVLRRRCSIGLIPLRHLPTIRRIIVALAHGFQQLFQEAGQLQAHQHHVLHNAQAFVGNVKANRGHQYDGGLSFPTTMAISTLSETYFSCLQSAYLPSIMLTPLSSLYTYPAATMSSSCIACGNISTPPMSGHRKLKGLPPKCAAAPKAVYGCCSLVLNACCFIRRRRSPPWCSGWFRGDVEQAHRWNTV